MGRLKPLKGTVSINSGLRIGHFTQHSSDNFDLKLSAVENLLNMYEDAEDQEMRSFLGKSQVGGGDNVCRPQQKGSLCATCMHFLAESLPSLCTHVALFVLFQ